MKTIVLLTALCVTLAGSALAEDQHQHRRPDDIKQYLEHLDSTERDRYQKPSEVIEALRLKPGMAVADLGSGSGYFTRRFIEAVTETGIVYAVDVEPEMLAYAKESVIHMHTAYTAEFILAQPDNPKLPFASVDLLFVCNTIHHLENRSKYFSNLKSSLKPEARIAIIDFYPDERSGDLGFPKHHLVARDAVIQEMTAAGYQLTREHSFLPKQYFLEFGVK
ncbi:MAG: methyltransferase domain-containing protein [Nitrospira sp.]|jgi:ubiquinone/menaquinone biosynthesis C-methylase UbiE|nr:MAG: methyltransferase domain-containing protein [Nitrospira sp.]